MADTIERNTRKERQGVVVSDVQDKTIVVRVERRTTHPLYGKTLSRSKKYHAHDEDNTARVGDTVRIQETRPYSKLKRWRLADIVERAK
jgi:small subunit ribosomal protein S17